jgi:hypothetical protein
LDLPRISKDIPYLTASQMAEVDWIMIKDYKIELKGLLLYSLQGRERGKASKA